MKFGAVWLGRARDSAGWIGPDARAARAAMV